MKPRKTAEASGTPLQQQFFPTSEDQFELQYYQSYHSMQICFEIEVFHEIKSRQNE